MVKRKQGKAIRTLCCLAMSVTLLAQSALPALAEESADAAGEDPGVVVLFEGEDEKDLTGTEVRRMLGMGNDAVNVQVEDVWNFEDEDMSVALVHSASEKNPSRLAARLEKRADVKIAEENFPIHMESVSEDPYSDFQWSMQSTKAGANVEAAWESVTGTERVVAVCDTGVDYRHPDLKDNMWVNPFNDQGLKGKYGYDFIFGDPDPMDENGHGTHCAGIIGAVGGNDIGISGVNQSVKIMALRILNADGGAFLSHEVAAYHYINKAMDLGVPVVAINNSWGGGRYSRIFETLVNTLGEKGAISVMAAGNDGSDTPDYPVYIDTPYMLRVAATNVDGELASYSNYGDWVDIAAPGTSILSTVCYDCYNPRLYGHGKMQQSISKAYYDYEDKASEWFPEEVYLNGKPLNKKSEGDTLTFADEDGRSVEFTVSEEGFLGGKGLSLSTTLKGDDLLVIPLAHYTAGDESKVPPHLSISGRALAESENTAELFLGEVADNNALTRKTLSGMDFLEITNYTMTDLWRHKDCTAWERLKKGAERQFILVLDAEEDGTYDAVLDDLGISNQTLESTESFGKYDFMSGTSMATPFISGAVALQKERMEKAGDAAVGPLDLINEMTAMTKETPSLAICDKKGAFDFSRPAIHKPRIADVTVKSENGKSSIELTGSGLDTKAENFSLEITKGEDTKVLTSKDVTGDSHKLTFADQGWSNNVVDIMVTANDGTALKEDLYLVKGKKTYTDSDALISSNVVYTTDGKLLYWLDAENECFTYTDPMDEEQYGTIEIPKDLVKMEKNPNQEYRYACDALVYMNGCIYAEAEYGAADASEFSGEYKVYDGKKLLLCADTVTGDVTALDFPNLGELEEYTMAAYNGKLYLMGGITRTEEDDADPVVSSAVKVFDPEKKTWSEGKSLPEGRYGGKALQTGNVLVYTLGYDRDIYLPDDDSEDMEMPAFSANLIFDGNTWKKSAAAPLVPHCGWINPGVGIVEGGILYTGLPAADLGDTFIFDVKADKYTDTGVNLVTDLYNVPDVVMVMGRAAYAGFMEEDDEELSLNVKEMPVQSGFLTIEQEVTGCGTVQGPQMTPPGNDVKLVFTAEEGLYMKSLTIDGKAVPLKKNTATYTYTFKNLMKSVKVQAAFMDWSDTPSDPGGSEYTDPVYANNTLAVKGKTVKLSAKKIASKKVKIKAKKLYKFTDKGQGELYFYLDDIVKGKKLKKSAKKKLMKAIKVNGTKGIVTIKKKGLKKGTYKLKIGVTASGDAATWDATQIVTVKLVVK